jgi:hypothetical protein
MGGRLRGSGCRRAGGRERSSAGARGRGACGGGRRRCNAGGGAGAAVAGDRHGAGGRGGAAGRGGWAGIGGCHSRQNTNKQTRDPPLATAGIPFLWYYVLCTTYRLGTGQANHRAASWAGSLHEREGYDVADARVVGQQHHDPVDADAEPARRRHPVLERGDEVVVDLHLQAVGQWCGG